MRISLYVLLWCLIVMSSSITTLYSQVGLNTLNPEGIIDVYSDSNGLVLPRLALTATNVMAPATNPKFGVTMIPVGTTVYNTNITQTGSNDVTIGMYAWDGAKWAPQFNQRHVELFESIIYMRTRSNATLAISGIHGSTFTAAYTGTYRIRVSVNYGGGNTTIPNPGTGGTQSDGHLNIARQSGTFNLTIGGDSYSIPAHTYSTAYSGSASGQRYFAIWQEFNSTFYKNFTTNDTASISMTFTQDPAPEFISSGNGGTGMGYIAYDIPCTVEFTYIGE